VSLVFSRRVKAAKGDPVARSGGSRPSPPGLFRVPPPGLARGYHVKVSEGLGALGKWLVAVGLSTAAVGALVLLASRFPGLRLGRLPGDISVGRDGFRLYLPLGTSILLSVVLSLVLWLLGRRR